MKTVLIWILSSIGIVGMAVGVTYAFLEIGGDSGYIGLSPGVVMQWKAGDTAYSEDLDLTLTFDKNDLNVGESANVSQITLSKVDGSLNFYLRFSVQYYVSNESSGDDWKASDISDSFTLPTFKENWIKGSDGNYYWTNGNWNSNEDLEVISSSPVNVFESLKLTYNDASQIVSYKRIKLVLTFDGIQESSLASWVGSVVKA